MRDGDSDPTSTVDQVLPNERNPDHPKPYLFVVLHCDRPLAGGARYNLVELDRVTIGRGTRRSAHLDAAERTLHLRLPSNIISSQHACIERTFGPWRLKDAGSRNGTYVNGERAVDLDLQDGDIIQIGPVILRFRAALLPDSPDLDIADPRPAVRGLTTLVPDLGARHQAFPSIARSPASVLLLGETGTGKEVMAHAIHSLSERPGPLVAINCGGLVANLVESHLFGHKKGAFTGAARDEPGYVRAAHRGTLFLDEIGDLPLPVQAALLRVLQEREVVPVGSTQAIQVDLRVLAATHRPLEQMATAGGFRKDLLARLSGYCLELTPLRERREDLGLLLGDLLRRPDIAQGESLSLQPDAGLLLVQYDWPLNIRELHQCLVAAAALAQDGVIEVDHLPAPVRRAPPLRPVLSASLQDPDSLRRTLIHLLQYHQGNITNVARDLGKARVQIHRWLQRLGLDAQDFRPPRPKSEPEA
jgi:hypothetical protein